MRGPRAVRLADVEHIRPDSWLSPASRKALATALARARAYDAQAGRPMDAAWLVGWKAHLVDAGLAPKTINLYMSALRAVLGAAYHIGLVPLELVAQADRVKNVPQRGRPSGRWLDAEQATRLLATPGRSTLRGLRDTAILALLLGAGLRRMEVSELRFEHLRPVGGRMVVCGLVSKGNRTRDVPVPEWAWSAVEGWTLHAGISSGYVFRAIHSTGALYTGRMGCQVTYRVVTTHARAAGLDVRPHDLRRTFARLAYQNGAALDQLQMTLGHASMQTTEVYLGTKQDLARAPADLLPVMLESDAA